MLDGSFAATGSSPSWYAVLGGFSVGITITAGTNSLTLEQEIGGAWFTKGSAKTATGVTDLIANVDYRPSTKFRLTCGTFNTGPVTYTVQGDIFGMSVIEDLGLPLEDSFMLQSGVDSWLLENGDQWLLENA